MCGRAVVERDYFPLAFESGEHLSADETERLQAVIEDVKRQFPVHEILVSRAAKDPHRFEQDRVWVVADDGSVTPIQQASHFIGHLERIDRFRVYAPRARIDEVAAAMRRGLG